MAESAFQIRSIRGAILDGLKAFYPNALGAGTIHKAILLPAYPTIEWDQALDQVVYLAQRGFLEEVKGSGIHRAESQRERMFRLTAKGYDLALGVTQDPTVQVEA